jgi:hypothetical protein
MIDPTTTNLWHGYTLTHIDHLARTAAHRAYGGRILDPTDRYQTAWSAIAELLCTADQAPTARDATIAGMNAVNQAGRDRRHTWGLGPAWGGSEGDAPQFQRYWDFGRVTPSPEDSIVDRLAVRQIWPRLSLAHRQILWALAVHGDCRTAAASLGKTERAYACALHRARGEFYRLWHEHETPSGMWGKTGRSGRRTVSQVLADRRRQRVRRTTTTTTGKAA